MSYLEFIFLILPGLALIFGGLCAFVYEPSKKIESAVQHLAAGIVLAVVAVELTPYLMHDVHRVAVGVGFVVGVLLMFFVEWFSDRMQHETQKTALPLALIAAVAVDIFIDGILVGIALIVGVYEGGLIAVGLGIEIFFLGLAVSHALMKCTRAARCVSLWMLMLVPFFGALIGRYVFADLPTVWLDGVLALGVAALLYLAIEELLLEAHENYNAYSVNSLFFLGFLVIFLFKL